MDPQITPGISRSLQDTPGIQGSSRVSRDSKNLGELQEIRGSLGNELNTLISTRLGVLLPSENDLPIGWGITSCNS